MDETDDLENIIGGQILKIGLRLSMTPLQDEHEKATAIFLCYSDDMIAKRKYYELLGMNNFRSASRSRHRSPQSFTILFRAELVKNHIISATKAVEYFWLVES